jgi:hypothetical protein
MIIFFIEIFYLIVSFINIFFDKLFNATTMFCVRVMLYLRVMISYSFRQAMLVIPIILALHGFGQSERFAFGIRSGLSLPVGAYAAKQLADGSFTLPGFAAVGEASLLVYQDFGLVLQGGVQFHPLDVGALGWAKVLDDPFLQDVYIRSEPYRIIHAVGGIDYRHKLGKGFILGTKALGGIFFSQTPFQVYRPTYFITGPDFFLITSASDRSFAYGAGLDISYQINDCLQLNLGTDYLRSRAAFGFISAGSQRVEWRNIVFLNMLFGIRLAF